MNKEDPIEDFEIPGELKPDIFPEKLNLNGRRKIGRVNCPICNKRVYLISNTQKHALFFSFVEKHDDCLNNDEVLRKLIEYPPVFIDCDNCPFPSGCAVCDGNYFL